MTVPQCSAGHHQGRTLQVIPNALEWVDDYLNALEQNPIVSEQGSQTTL